MTESPPRAYAEPEGEGWRAFATVLFAAVAIGNLMWGIAALAGDDHFKAEELLFGDLTLWGVIYLVAAALQGATALLLIRGSAAGAILGSILAALHAIVLLASVGAYPLWSGVLLVIDGLLIYALLVHCLRPSSG
jgi:hypothetical protein